MNIEILKSCASRKGTNVVAYDGDQCVVEMITPVIQHAHDQEGTNAVFIIDTLNRPWINSKLRSLQHLELFQPVSYHRDDDLEKARSFVRSIADKKTPTNNVVIVFSIRYSSILNNRDVAIWKELSNLCEEKNITIISIGRTKNSKLQSPITSTVVNEAALGEPDVVVNIRRKTNGKCSNGTNAKNRSEDRSDS